MKVRRGLLIIDNYRNTGWPWWDQAVGLQVGAKALAGGGGVTAKKDFKPCHDRYIFFSECNINAAESFNYHINYFDR